MVGAGGFGCEGRLGQREHMLDGVESLELGGAKQAHQDGVGLGAVLGAILLTDLAGEDSGAHLLFGVVVVGADLGVVEEGEHLLAMAPKAFDESLGIGIGEDGIDDLIEACMQFRFAAGVGLWVEWMAPLPEPYGVFEETGERPSEALPLCGGVALVDFDELGEEMEEAFLFGQRLNRVVGAPEVGDKDAGEEEAEYLFDDDGTAVAIDEVVAILLGGERPEPEGAPLTRQPVSSACRTAL